MLVMLSCGPKTSAIIERVSKQLDNVDFHHLSNVVEFINQSKLRHFAFDRLVFSSKFISSDEDMSKLCDYVREELSSVEMVIMLNKDTIKLYDIFHKYFDSPMYTVMYDDNPTAKSIVDAIKLPILEIREIYSMKKEDSSGDKKSIFGKFKGGKKNTSSGDINVKSKSEESVKSDENVTAGSDKSTSTANNSWEDDYRDIPNKEEDSKNVLSNELDISTSGNNQSSASDVIEQSTDDLDLSIGQYGEQHSDSGFLGESGLEELSSFSNGNNLNTHYNESISVVSDYVDVSSNSDKEDVNNKVNFKTEESNGTSSNSSLVHEGKLNFIIGLGGSGSTAYVVDTAMSIVSNGKNVLIVDLDYHNNGILSFIDVRKFYSSNSINGVNNYIKSGKGSAYKEDGVSILSNGYDVDIDCDLSVLLDTVVKDFDIVLIDCPLDCLSVVSDNTFVKSNIIICTISDISKLIEFSSFISNRDFVSLKKEVKIIRDSKVANNDISEDDINYVKDNVLFPNGCWLDNK